MMGEVTTYPVRHALMNEFRELAIGEGCKVEKVIEQIQRQMIVYWLRVPDGKEELISDMAFMTFITNAAFQKYYELTDEVSDRIKQDEEFNKYAQDQREKDKNELLVEKMDDQLVVRLILDEIYPLWNKEEKRFAYLKNKHGFYFGTCKKENFDKYWTRQIFYLGEGQLNDEQKEAITMIDKFKVIEKLSPPPKPPTQ